MKLAEQFGKARIGSHAVPDLAQRLRPIDQLAARRTLGNPEVLQLVGHRRHVSLVLHAPEHRGRDVVSQRAIALELIL